MPEYLVQHYLDNSQKLRPESLAVCSPEASITYRELFESSNQVCNALLRMGVRRQDRVAFRLARSPRSIVAIMGILKADAIYVPIDPKAPPERFRKIFDDCRPAAFICDARTAIQIVDQLPHQVHLPPIVILGGGTCNVARSLRTVNQEEISSLPTSPPEYRNVDTDIAYILYTSGSTGTPKGVMISHLNITNYINWAVEWLDISADDVVLSTAPFHFDMSTFDIYCPLKAGSALAIATEDMLLFPRKLVKFIETKGVTLWKGISSLLMYMARTGCLQAGSLPTLKKILFSGEVLPTRYLMEWMRCYPNKQFYNGYGPTEATGMSTCHYIHTIPLDPREVIPIGKACANTEILLLDENNTPVLEGEIGELCIRGSGVSPGYWNNPVKTSQAFVTNPLTCRNSDALYRTGDLARQRADGGFEFIGRKDSQVKYMGYRIELGEIENALMSLGRIRSAAVLFCEDQRINDEGLVAFVEVDDEQDAKGIVAELKSLLPHYMLPRLIIPVQHLPRTDRGKIDRVKLMESLKHTNPFPEDQAVAGGLRR